MHFIVGSGPAGIACAHALLARRQSVTLLDGGIDLEPQRREVVHRMAMVDPGAWRPEWAAMLKEGMTAGTKGVPLKRAFGSDFPYREGDEHLPMETKGTDIRPSFAKGGLSNVWGAAILPYSDRDLATWPIVAGDLAPHYRAVVGLTGLAGRHDQLAAMAPLYTDSPEPVVPSPQAEHLLRRMERHRATLNRQGWCFGQSRLALKAPGQEQAGCRLCGACLYGCPYDCIYNSAATLGGLRQDPLFSYQPDVVVETVGESGGQTWLRGYDRITKAPREWHGTRVFLACGALGTTRVLLESRKAFRRPVSLRDSQYFLFPLLQLRRNVPGELGRAHTLSQVFIEWSQGADQPTIHTQIYGYNDLLPGAVAGALPSWLRGTALPAGLAHRLLIGQAYLHSDLSSRIAVELLPAATGTRPRLKLDAMINPQAAQRARAHVWRFTRAGARLGAVALPPLLELAPPGRGYHTGGSFPMRPAPGDFETDLLGRPAGWQRIHAVDSTVFPTIPAPTITLTIMANAHRIASLAPAS